MLHAMDAIKILLLVFATNVQLEMILICVNNAKRNLNNHIHLSRSEILKMPQLKWFANMEIQKKKNYPYFKFNRTRLENLWLINFIILSLKPKFH